MSSLRFTVFGDAAPAGSKTRASSPDGSRTWTRDSSKRSYPWKAAVSAAAGEAVNGAELLDGPLLLELIFYRPRPRGHFTGLGALSAAGRRMPAPTTKPDALKLARAVEDALTGIVYRDDATIVVERIEKRYGEPARVEVLVSELGYGDRTTPLEA